MSQMNVEAKMKQARHILKEHWGHDDFRPAQTEILKHVFAGEDVLGILNTGYGKCFGAGTPILKYDGTVCAVEEIQTGDLLMGPDSKPRRVLRTCTGRDRLYEVKPVKGDSYIVNSRHILSLKKTRQGGSCPSQQGGQIVNVCIAEWLSSSNRFKHLHKGWRTGVEFSQEKSAMPTNIPPYFLGVWLGDGTVGKVQITDDDPYVIRYLRQFAKKQGLELRKSEKKNACYCCRLVDAANRYGRGHQHPLAKSLRELNVLNEKHVPHIYLTASREDRLQLLAGLLDTDGYVQRGVFEITSKFRRLADDILFLARSLGFAAYCKSSYKKCQTGGGGIYHRILISGDFSTVPNLVPKKQMHRRRQKKNVLMTGIKVRRLRRGLYFGFEVDGDGLFLLGDFTVTHNSVCFQVPAMMSEGTCMVVSPLIALMKDQVDDLHRRNIPASFINSHVDLDEQAKRFRLLLKGKYKLFYIAPERINSAEFRKILPAVKVSLWAIDECHSVSLMGNDYRPAYARIKELVALTATPCEGCRGRGKDKETGKICPWCDGSGNERPPILAVTATATGDIEADIGKGLTMRTDHVRVVGDPIRENLSYDIRYGSMFPHLGVLVEDFNLHEGRYLIYSVTKKSVDAIAPFVVEKLTTRLTKKGQVSDPANLAAELVGIYHGGLTPNDAPRFRTHSRQTRLGLSLRLALLGWELTYPISGRLFMRVFLIQLRNSCSKGAAARGTASRVRRF